MSVGASHSSAARERGARRARPKFPGLAALLFGPGATGWLLPLLRPFHQRLALLFALSFAAAALALLPPYVSKLVIDEGLVGRDSAALIRWTLVLFALGLAVAGMSALSNILHMRASVRMLACLRQSLLERLMQKPPAWLARHRAGELLTRLDGDSGEVQKFAFNALLGGTSALVRLAGGSIMLMVLNWKLGLLTALLAPAELLFLIWARPRTGRFARAAREAQGRYTAGLSESLGGAAALQTAGGTPWAEARNLAEHGQLNRRLVAQYQWGEFTRSVPMVIAALVRAGIFLAGGLLVVQGSWPLGSLIAFLAYMGLMIGPMQSLLGLWHAQARVRVALGRLDAVMDPGPARAATPLRALQGTGIVLEDLVVGRGKQPPLKPLSLDVPPGCKLAFTGPSGIGKSRLLSVISGRAPPLAGRVCHGGALRIAFAGQRPFTVAASLRENLFLHASFWAAPGAETKVWALLEVLGLAARFRAAEGLDTVLGEGGISLSGGERQRLCLARLLLRPFDVLILDEALSEVDTKTTARIISHIDAQFPQATRIITAHGQAGAYGRFDRTLDLSEQVP
ncbi:ABC transporter transmembrane domain-containing protein [Cribrihabitans neustonicus]|uniref:ABC transporter transmembrane domain-containing protein n=1 Tax=Cribrihabitans neustonicus TaxID=1429085 RepID=UPI003B5A3716